MKGKKSKLLFIFALLLSVGLAGNSWAFTSLPTLAYTGTATGTESAGSVSLSLDAITTIDRASYLNGDFTDINNSEETIIDAVLSMTGLTAGDCSTAPNGYFFFPAIATMAITGPDNFVYMTADVSYLPPGSSVLFLFDGSRWLLYPPTLDSSDPTLLNLSNIQLYTDGTHPSRYVDEFAAALNSGSSDIAGMTMIVTPQPGSGTLCDGSTDSTFNIQGLVDGAPAGVTNSPPTAEAGVTFIQEECLSTECEINLDGSESTDPDSTTGTNDDIVSFDWYEDVNNDGIYESSELIASGETATVILPIGSYDITLLVTDSQGATDVDVITVVIDAAELSFFEIEKAHVKKDGKIKISGKLALPAGVYHLDVNSVGHVAIALSTLGNVIDESVDFIEHSNGNKWKFNSSSSFGITKFRIDWSGAKFNYQNGPLTIKSHHIGDDETELSITSCEPVSIDIAGTIITIDENDIVSCSDASVKVDGDDDGDSDDSDSDGGNSSDDDGDDCTVGVRLPFDLTPDMVINITGSVDASVLVGDYYTAVIGKFKLHGRFDATGIVLDDLMPKTLDLTVDLGDEGFTGTLVIDEATWTKIKPKYWKFKLK